MVPQKAEEFTRAFSQAWLAQDAEAIGDLFSEDADFLSLTGAWAEGRKEIVKVVRGEWKGAFARAKLVTGRGKLRPLGPVVAVVHQRFVLSGIMNADGSDAGRIATVLIATLSWQSEGWMAVSAQFVVEGG